MAALAEQVNAIKSQIFIRTEIGDDLLASSYLRFKAEETLEYLYPDGHQPSLLEFIQWAHRPDVITCGGFVKKSNIGLPDGPLELASIGWLSAVRRFPTHSIADIGYGFFRKFMTGDLTTEVGRMFLEFAFDHAKIDLLCGATPVPNRPARIFVEKMGFKRVGEIPMMGNWKGVPCPILISYLQKSDWERGL